MTDLSLRIMRSRVWFILLFSNWLILLAYENGDCPAISVPQNGRVSQEAPNLLNQAKKA